MSNEETLAKAIQQAYDNGDWVRTPNLFDAPEDPEKLAHWLIEDPFELIFDHAFAKALWGEATTWFLDDRPKDGWQFHLQRMVIANDPIVYLGKNL